MDADRDTEKLPLYKRVFDLPPRVITTLAVYTAVFVKGAGVCVFVAMGLAALGDDVSVSTYDLTVLFVCRGVGLTVTAPLATFLLERKSMYISKHVLCCGAIFVAGLVVGVLPMLISPSLSQANVPYLRLAVLLEGASFGAVESFGTAALSEMWGQYLQQWMALKMAFWGLGCLLATVLLSFYSYEKSYEIVAYIGFITFLVVFIEYIYLYSTKQVNAGIDDDKSTGVVPTENITDENNDENGDRQRSGSLESAITKVRGRSRAGSRIRSDSLLGSKLAELEEYRPQSSSQPNEATMPFYDNMLNDNTRDPPRDIISQVNDQLRSDEIDIIMQGIELLHQEKRTIITDAETALDMQQFVQDALQNTSEVGPYEMRSRAASFESQHSTHATLTYANPYIAEFVRDQPEGVDVGIKLIPHKVSLLNGLIIFGADGLGCTIGYWIMLYASKIGVEDPLSQIIIVSLLNTGLVVGSVGYIPLIIIGKYPSLHLIIAHVILLFMAAIFLQIQYITFVMLCLTTFAIGVGISNFFPLALNLANDSGFTIDNWSILSMIVGSCLGQSILPMIGEMLLTLRGWRAYNTFIVTVALAIALTCYSVHRLLLFEMKQRASNYQQVPVKSSFEQNDAVTNNITETVSPLHIEGGLDTMSVNEALSIVSVDSTYTSSVAPKRDDDLSTNSTSSVPSVVVKGDRRLLYRRRLFRKSSS